MGRSAGTGQRHARDRYRRRRHMYAAGTLTTDEQAGAASAAEQTAPPGIDPAVFAELEAQAEKVNQENGVLREAVTRQRSEFDNFRRRTAKEKDQARDMAREDLAVKLLPVLDNFERALESAQTIAAGSTDEALREGVAMVAGQFRRLLEAEGLVKIEALGAQFDPIEHEALAVEDRTDIPDNHVSQVLLTGYRFGGKVIRAAMVKVARSSVTKSGHTPAPDRSTPEPDRTTPAPDRASPAGKTPSPEHSPPA